MENANDWLIAALTSPTLAAEVLFISCVEISGYQFGCMTGGVVTGDGMQGCSVALKPVECRYRML